MLQMETWHEMAPKYDTIQPASKLVYWREFEPLKKSVKAGMTQATQTRILHSLIFSTDNVQDSSGKSLYEIIQTWIILKIRQENLVTTLTPKFL